MNEYVYDRNWDGKEVWKVTDPDGKTLDFYESSKERAENYMVIEAMTGCHGEQDAAQKAYDRGYKIERVK